MKALIYLALLAIISLLSFQIYSLNKQRLVLKSDFDKITKELTPLNKENKELIAEINYLKNPDNLEKELRSRFNYVKPGEKLIIVVPESQ